MSFPMREFIRWVLCGTVAVMAHAALAAGFVAWREEPDDDGEPSGAVVMELAPLAVTRMDVPLDIAPGPDQVQSEAVQQAPEEKQAEKTEEQPALAAEEKPVLPLASAPDAEAALPQAEKPPAQPKQAPQPQLPAPVTSAVQALSDQQGPVAQAPVQAAPKAAPSDALPKWQHRLETILERNKRYPGAAQNRREQGVVLVSFVVDKLGRLQSSHIVRSSGHAALDDEAISLLHRSGPFPPPPPDLPGAHVSVVAPVRFNLQ